VGLIVSYYPAEKNGITMAVRKWNKIADSAPRGYAKNLLE
jgi:hypothetical protein